MSENYLYNEQTPAEEQEIDFKRFFFSLVARWWWFVISVPVCVGIALYFYLSATPVYEIGANLMINDSAKKEFGPDNVLAGLVNPNVSNAFVENEILEMKSYNLIREVVEDLGLNVRYYTTGNFRDIELYKASPIRIVLQNPTIRESLFFYVKKDQHGLILTDPETRESRHVKYGEIVDFNDLRFTIEKTEYEFTQDRITVTLSSFFSVAVKFHAQLNVSLLEKWSNAVRIAVSDNVPARGIDLINAIVEKYNTNGVVNKRMVAASTVDFINKRLFVLDKELGDIESQAEVFKKEHKITDIASDAANVATRKNMVDEELLSVEMDLSLVRSIKDYFIYTGEKEYVLLPEELGLSDASLKDGISKYNELVLKRTKLLNTASEDNPAVIAVNRQLDGMKQNLHTNIRNVESALMVKIGNLEKENQAVNRLLASVPTQEKIYRSISRQQEIKEKLFLFLLQKREEAEIAKLMYQPSAKIIEDPRSSSAPISPKRNMIIMVGLFLGLCLPAGVIILLEMLNNKVQGVEEVEKRIKVPILGVFPHLPADKVATPLNDDFLTRESVNLIREKVNYVVGSKEKGVIMVTSTLPGEGKSQLTSFLAYSYARAGKKVIVVGCDLRNPQMHNYFKIKSEGGGLSGYLAGLGDTDDRNLIHHVEAEFPFDVIFGGPVPPNPMQLVSGPRLGELVDRLKERYDYVLIDTPPVGVLADGFSVAPYVDMSVYIVRAGVMEKNALQLINDFESTGRLKRIGIIVNDVIPSRFAYGYKYGYGYGYGHGYGYGYYYGSYYGDKEANAKKKHPHTHKKKITDPAEN